MTSMSCHTAKMTEPQRMIKSVHRPQIVGDVLLVAFWAIATPGLMWLGAYLGY